MSLPSRACEWCKQSKLSIVARECRVDFGAVGKGSDIYLGEDGGPDGLNFLDLGGTEDGLDLVGLNGDSRSVTHFAQ